MKSSLLTSNLQHEENLGSFCPFVLPGDGEETRTTWRCPRLTSILAALVNWQVTVKQPLRLKNCQITHNRDFCISEWHTRLGPSTTITLPVTSSGSIHLAEKILKKLKIVRICLKWFYLIMFVFPSFYTFIHHHRLTILVL